MSKKCPFCRVIEGRDSADKVYENELIIAFLHIAPVNKGHTIIAPRRHHGGISAVDKETLACLMECAPIIATAAMRAVGAEGYNILICNGNCAGQFIEHAALEAIPRFTDDGIILPTGSVPYQNRTEKEEIITKMKEKFASRL